jgi:hypothetical protein
MAAVVVPSVGAGGSMGRSTVIQTAPHRSLERYLGQASSHGMAKSREEEEGCRIETNRVLAIWIV